MRGIPLMWTFLSSCRDKNRKEVTIVKKFLCTLLALIMVIGCSGITAWAADANMDNLEKPATAVEIERATGSFNVTIPANGKARAGSSFPLESGEIVTIKASYSPFSASLSFVLVDPDGKGHAFSVTGGSVNKGIRVDKRGNYTLQIWNNSAQSVSVSGYVNY